MQIQNVFNNYDGPAWSMVLQMWSPGPKHGVMI